MGWTSYQATHYKNGRIDRKAECDSIFNNDMVTWDDDRKIIGKYEVLKSTMVGGTYYAAIKRTKFATETEPEQSLIFAMVCLTSTNMKDYYSFSYKDMDESMGPYCYDCPKSILDLLSPTDNEYANQWRQACYENIDKKKNPNSLNKLPDGTVIKVTLPWDTTRYNKGDEVTLTKKRWGKHYKWFASSCYFTRGLMKSLEGHYEIIQRGEA